MTTKPFISTILALAYAIPAAAEFRSPWRIDDSKYDPGDCITATDQSLSFYGHYARVEGVVSFSGLDQTGVYVLSFPIYDARTPLHSKTIEDRTQRVEDDFCKRQTAD